MSKLEELLANKLIDILHYSLSKLVIPNFKFDKVTDIDADMVEKLKNYYGIEAIILDVDETIRKDYLHRIPKHNKEWIESLKGKLKVIIMSNGIDRKLEKYFREQGIDYISFALKPLKRNFRVACKRAGVRPERVLVVGNSLFHDIHGGNRSNMMTALVKRVEDDERDS